MGLETFTKGMQDANEMLNRNFAAVETQLNGLPIRLFVSVNGSDEFGNGMQDKPYRTVRKAIDAIKPYHTDAVIRIGAGDYDEQLFIGYKVSSIALTSETPENKAKLKCVTAYDCRSVALNNLRIDGTNLAADLACVTAFRTNDMQIYNCEITGHSAIGGVSANESQVFVRNTSISGCSSAVTTCYNSLLTAYIVAGTDNQIGYSAHSSILNISGLTLQAATPIVKREGGIIYKDGVQV